MIIYEYSRLQYDMIIIYYHKNHNIIILRQPYWELRQKTMATGKTTVGHLGLKLDLLL